MGTYLVTGASRGYGYEIACHLRVKGHQVFEAQRNPSGKEAMDPIEALNSWRDCNLADPTDVVRVVQSFQSSQVKLDGVIHAACHRRTQPAPLLNAHDLQEHFMVNVFAPVTMTMYLEQFQALAKDACIMFLIDRRPLDEKHLAYKTSKAAIATTFELFLDVLPATLRPVYAILPEYEGNEAILKIVDAMVEVLTGDAKSNRVLDLREELPE